MEKAISTSTIGAGNFLTGTIETLRTRLDQYSKYRETVRELSSLSDRDLTDLGLSRSMIKTLARETAYGDQ